MDLSTVLLKQQKPLNQQLENKYFETDLIYSDLSDLVNHQYKAWYCSKIFELGRERVMILASQARADGTNKVKLFSHLLKKASKR